jgi:hypothetical protein
MSSRPVSIVLLRGQNPDWHSIWSEEFLLKNTSITEKANLFHLTCIRAWVNMINLQVSVYEGHILRFACGWKWGDIWLWWTEWDKIQRGLPSTKIKSLNKLGLREQINKIYRILLKCILVHFLHNSSYFIWTFNSWIKTICIFLSYIVLR